MDISFIPFSPKIDLVSLVSKNPGETVFTRILYSAISAAKVAVIPSIANFDEE